MSKTPKIFPQIGEGFEDVFNTLAKTPTPTEHTPKEKVEKKEEEKQGESNEK